MYVALKEIRRSLGRFSLLIGAVALLVLLLLFFQAVSGTLTSGITGGLEATSADVLVYDTEARGNPSSSVISPTLMEQVAAIDGVEQVSPIGIGVFPGQQDGDGIDVALVGGDPLGPSAPAELEAGRRPDRSGEAVFSASSFDATPDLGAEITVEGTTFTVVGTADNAPFNVLPTLYVEFDDYVNAVQERAGAPLDVPLSLIGVAVEPDADATTVASAVTQEVLGVEGFERSAAVDAIPGVGQITQSFSILYVLLYIVVTIVTGVFFLILTVQKKDALVLLRAVGASSREVVTSVLIQVAVVVGLGLLVGIAVAALLLGITSDVFGATLQPSTTAVTAVIVAALGMLASVGAVRRVLAIDPLAANQVGGI